MSICNICVCDLESDEDFVTCSNGHNIHADDCLAQYLNVTQSNIEKNVCDFWQKTQKIKCPLGECSIDEDQIFTKKASLIKLWTSTVLKIAAVVERQNAIMDAEREALKEAEKQKKDLENKIIADITKISNTCIACPYCKLVFYDFTGCLSLTCASCKKVFCGVCLKIHGSSLDAHADVKSHMDTFTPEIIKEYKFNGSYFISMPGWELWKEKLKIDAIMEYLKTIRKEYVRNLIEDVLKHLQKSMLLSPEACKIIYGNVFSYQLNNVHLIRISTTFWLIYSSKNNMRFEDVVKNVKLPFKAITEIELEVIKRIKLKWSSYVQIKNLVPGENFEATNYPVKSLPVIIDVIEEWGARNNFW